MVSVPVTVLYADLGLHARRARVACPMVLELALERIVLQDTGDQTIKNLCGCAGFKCGHRTWDLARVVCQAAQWEGKSFWLDQRCGNYLRVRAPPYVNAHALRRQS